MLSISTKGELKELTINTRSWPQTQMLITLHMNTFKRMHVQHGLTWKAIEQGLNSPTSSQFVSSARDLYVCPCVQPGHSEKLAMQFTTSDFLFLSLWEDSLHLSLSLIYVYGCLRKTFGPEAGHFLPCAYLAPGVVLDLAPGTPLFGNVSRYNGGVRGDHDVWTMTLYPRTRRKVDTR